MEIQLKRIGMWACPRCLSTVMLRSWGNRPDTFVHDEPFYPHYLLCSGREDPGKDEVLKNYETDWVKIVEQLTTGSIPDEKSIYYQKFMVYRLLPHIDINWITKLTNCFLIREPQDMLLSYIQLWPNPTLETIGIMRLKQVFEMIHNYTGKVPPVIDARDLQENPRRILSLLCEAVEVEFTDIMLNWSKGNPTNDSWSKYEWYDTARNSTEFRPYKQKTDDIPERFHDLLSKCNEIYEELYEHRLV
ncbi:MAG: hypothetical protein SWX82_07025 [Cyanobacteriota bacterium]|nr:hypothetical protein [Cyanobacteriota bacterium]